MIVSTRTGTGLQLLKSLSTRLGDWILVVPVMMANPGHWEGQAIFVAAIRHEIEEVVGADREFTMSPSFAKRAA